LREKKSARGTLKKQRLSKKKKKSVGRLFTQPVLTK